MKSLLDHEMTVEKLNSDLNRASIEWRKTEQQRALNDIDPDELVAAYHYSVHKIKGPGKPGSKDEYEMFKFTLKHKHKAPVVISVDFDESDGNRPSWNELVPAAISIPLEATFKPFDIKRHAFQCLMLTIQGLKDTYEGLRPREELELDLAEYDGNIRHENPTLSYVIKEVIYTNAESKVYLATSKDDENKQFVVKVTPQ